MMHDYSKLLTLLEGPRNMKFRNIPVVLLLAPKHVISYPPSYAS